jgi:hypothetical protein
VRAGSRAGGGEGGGAVQCGGRGLGVGAGLQGWGRERGKLMNEVGMLVVGAEWWRDVLSVVWL